jgi:hypothetical protein
VSDIWGYLVLGAVGIGGGIVWLRHRNHDRNPHAEPRQRYRRLDTVQITCEHLDHRDRVPTATVALADLVRDIRVLRRLGWGGNTHTNICYYHNPDQHVPLDALHVVCSNDTCGERATIATGYGSGGFGQLRNLGWVNLADTADAVCPYCSGRRPRPKW